MSPLDLRYTTQETLALCMRIADVSRWDLDVAADAESHHAQRWFDAEEDGLKQPWSGAVWCNPPFSDIEPWVVKARAEMRRLDGPSVIAMLLPSNRTEQPWWQTHIEPVRDRRIGRDAAFITTHFLPKRLKFGSPGNRDAVGVGSPPFGCVLLVWRRA